MTKKIELVMGETFQLDKKKATIVLVDPAYASELGIEIINETLQAVLGHNAVMVMPLPAKAIKFYQINDEVVLDD